LNFRVRVRFGLATFQAPAVADYTGFPELCYFGLRSLEGEGGDFIPVSFSVPNDIQNRVPKRALQL
jgi:hypothetical protein